MTTPATTYQAIHRAFAAVGTRRDGLPRFCVAATLEALAEHTGLPESDVLECLAVLLEARSHVRLPDGRYAVARIIHYAHCEIIEGHFGHGFDLCDRSGDSISGLRVLSHHPDLESATAAADDLDRARTTRVARRPVDATFHGVGCREDGIRPDR